MTGWSFCCLSERVQKEEQPPKNTVYGCLGNTASKSFSSFSLLRTDTSDKSPECQRGSGVRTISKDKHPLALPVCGGLWLPFLNPLKHVGESVTNSATGGVEIFESAAKRRGKKKRRLF